MSEHIEQAAAAPEEDLLLPEGWTEDEDIFAGKAANEGTEGEALPPREKTPETAPTKGESPAASPKLRFTARVDHEDRQVELEESELPELYQKAQATERAQRRLRELSALKQADAARDLGAEAEELLRVFPEMHGRSIPTEVVLESLRGKKTLTAAFAAWNEQQHRPIPSSQALTATAGNHQRTPASLGFSLRGFALLRVLACVRRSLTGRAQGVLSEVHAPENTRTITFSRVTRKTRRGYSQKR